VSLATLSERFPMTATTLQPPLALGSVGLIPEALHVPASAVAVIAPAQLIVGGPGFVTCSVTMVLFGSPVLSIVRSCSRLSRVAAGSAHNVISKSAPEGSVPCATGVQSVPLLLDCTSQKILSESGDRPP